MNDHTLKVLEFPQLLKQIQAFALSDSGKDLIAKFKPQVKPRQAFQMRDLYKSLVKLRLENIELPDAEFFSPEVIMVKLAPEGAILDLLEIHVIAKLMKTSDSIRKFLTRESFKENKAFQKLAFGLYNYTELLTGFDALFDEKGDIKDSASPILQELKPQIRQLESKINNKLNKILKSDDGAIFQDSVVTRRNNRFVIPVRRESKGKINGIVHDESASGRTLFIEPQSVVQDGNALVSTIKDIENEVRKILSSVSSQLREIQDEIKKSFRALTRYDAAFAVSAWAGEYNCTFAVKSENFGLIKARHPILQQKFKIDDQEDHLVPLDFELRKAKVLAITGSNTGGKTVSLKTLGLFSLIYQTGLPIPAEEGSSMPFFSAIYADIGDEQSLQQSLSTFSGHIKNISEILEGTKEKKSLVLLDELGSGTDPVEGGALGCAIIDQLSKRDVTTFLTTHLSIIKVFVHENKSMVNASVRFNKETLQPEYILDIGLPGASHALSIAESLNLSKDVLDKAKSMLSEETIQLENVLEKLDSNQRSLSKNMEQAKVDSAKAAKERERLQKELQDLKVKRRSMLHDAQKEAESLVENARKEMEKILKSVRNKADSSEEIKKIKEKVVKKRDNLRHSIKQTEARPAEPVKAESINVGDHVWVEKLQAHASIMSISADKKKVQVDLNGMPFNMKVSELGKASQPAPKKDNKPQAKVNLHFKRSAVSMELNVIGKRVEDALNEVEKYLDNAMSSGMECVRIVHGRGTGALRQSLHNYLRDAKFVTKFSCPEPDENNTSGDSVTDVWL